MDVKNNPAGRLHDILSEARKHNPKEPAKKAWASAFHIDPEDTAALLQMLSELINLSSETKDSILRLDDVDHELHLKPFKKIENIFATINLNAPWESWKNQIDEATLYGLQFSADKLSRVSGFTQISNDELFSIRAEVDELFNTVSDSNLPRELKDLLLRNLSSIRNAFAAYKVRGIEGIHEEIERSVGSLLLHQEEIKRSNPEDYQVWTSFFTLVTRLNEVVNLARNSNALAAPTVQALTQAFS